MGSGGSSKPGSWECTTIGTPKMEAAAILVFPEYGAQVPDEP